MRSKVEMSLGAPARCRQSTIRILVVALLVSSLLILTVPSPVRAPTQTLQAHQPISIIGDSDFAVCGCVTQGNGSIQAPYIIENLEITNNTTAGIHIKNTHSYFTIRNVYIHPASITPGSSGILLENTFNGRVENSRIANFTNGIWLSLGAGDTLTANRIWSNTYGIYMTGTADKISNNQIYSNTQYGVYASGSTASLFTGNNASANGNQADGAGFIISAGTDNIFENNTVSSNTFYGFRIILASNNIFRNNTISKTRFGMIFNGGNFNNLAFNNTLSVNDFGIGLENIGQFSQSSNNITTNRITGNGFGIYVVNSTRNTIYNNYLNNTSNAYDENTQNAWNITKSLRTNILGGPFQGGNFYSDYQTQTQCNPCDPDADGIGDTPYIPSGGNQTRHAQDHLPLVQKQPTVVHDVTVTSIVAQPISARVGTMINITATAFNQGTVSESFTITFLSNQTSIATRNIANLTAFSTVTISQVWSTTSLAAGSYILRANVTLVPGEFNSGNSLSSAALVSLTLNQPPIAKFTINPTSTVAGSTVSIDAMASYDPDGTITTYLWNYGDGTPTGSTPKVSHSYSSAGTYTITLTVTDNEGASRSTSGQVSILSSPPSIPRSLTITATSTSATLTWSPPASTGGSPITRYNIYRGTSSTFLLFLATTGNVTRYLDTTVTSGQTLYYQVAAVNADGQESPGSATQDVLVPTSNTASLHPSIPVMWYIAAVAGLVIVGVIGGIVLIRRRTQISQTMS